MDNTQNNWQDSLRKIHLPRWQELPDIDIYMDQLVTLVVRYTSPFKVDQQADPLLTPAMVNNYVKQKLIPPPEKKKYNQRHLARLVIITILKQAFDLPIVQLGINWQTESGDYQKAYDQFCTQMEDTIQLFLVDDQTEKFELNVVDINFLPIQMATIALTSKLVAENTLQTLEKNKANNTI
ncbi:DUF1836 domain-containing protein [Vagococcus sp. BWB3-3]|uniref:DUF1836 domain-containing protein n=1 Tax=Vagococcus allomyrinae TaxID=2794353 RepID=A0A940SWI5_9ENTE|nr:DUF1836 domain-containing protein [Vagococcus allomyrinae]MBP1043034.1 DUF1836 domain-containing protein [Vagococcus allomyrinae]